MSSLLWRIVYFMADDLSLLFKLRGDASGVKTASAEARAAVNQLKNSFGPELTQTVTVANRAFANVAENLNAFVGQRIPLVGGAFIRLTGNLRDFGSESVKSEKAIAGIAKSIQSIATESGKSVPQIGNFLAKFALIEGQAKRDKAAIDFFGVALGAKLLPELEKTGTAMAAMAAESTAASGALAGLATPIGIAVVAIGALVAGLVLTSKELFQISKRAAEFQGRMFDLSQQTGVAVETLSALEVTARTTGGEIGNLTQALITFQRRLDDTSDPASKAAKQFQDLNITARDTESAFRQAFTALAAMPQGFQQTNDAAELFGARGGKQVLAIIKETNGDLDGAIKRFRELGILIEEGDARAADIFNDELALLEFQLRATTAVIAKDLIPVITDIIHSFGGVVRAGKPVLELFSSIAGIALRPVAQSLKGLSLIVQALTLDYKGLARSIKEANEEAAKSKDIPALTTEGPQPTPLRGTKSPQQVAQEAATTADAIVASAKRVAAAQNQALDTLFERGRIDRDKQADDAIASNKRVLKAETDRIDVLLKAKEEEFKALDRERLLKQEIANSEQKISQDVSKLQQDRLDKEAEFERTSAAIRSKAAKERADSRRNQVANETDLLVNEFDAQIKAIEAAIKQGITPDSEGLTTIEALEQAKIDARVEGLEAQKRIGFLTIQEQVNLNQQVQQLNQQRDRLEGEQQQRRLLRERETSERTRDIQLANIDALLEVESIRAERLIAANEALAEARVQSEEEAARRIFAIRLRLIDSEAEATETRLKAAASIIDVDERLRTEAELNNRLKILAEQRVSIQSQGERGIDEGRRRDVNNARRYADDLKEIQQRIVEIERDTAEEVIRLMVVNFARRKDIIRARRDLELAEEDDRHRRATDSINQQKLEVDEQIRVLEKRLERLKVGTQEEIEEYDRLIKKLEELRLKRDELKRQQDAEDKRNQTRKRRTEDETKKDEKEADPFGRLLPDIEDLKKFAKVIEDSIVPLGDILRNTFLQVADAIGQTVANWVLLGETGPAVMRKILATALASIAAEAAVNAIKELALGFAMLFINPAASASHFTSAAIWGSIAGGSAIAGRGVAGDLFKPTTGGGAGSGRSGASGELNPLNLARNAGPGAQQQFAPQIQPLQVTVNVVPDGSKFGDAVTAHYVEDHNNAGPMREIRNNDGNLNRG